MDTWQYILHFMVRFFLCLKLPLNVLLYITVIVLGTVLFVLDKEKHIVIPKCTLVEDRSMFSHADFVIFQNCELIQGQQRLPTHLTWPQNQGWVWLLNSRKAESVESPAHNGNVKPFNGLHSLVAVMQIFIHYMADCCPRILEVG